MPSVHWMKDGTPLEEESDNKIRIVTIPGRKSSRVEILEATIGYNGAYQCIASNEAGSVSVSFLVELLQGQSN